MNFDWRHVITLTLVLVAVVFGGVALELAETCSGTFVTRTVEDVPEDATVSPAEPVMENEHLGEAIEEAVEFGTGRSVVTSEEMNTALDRLESVPAYGGGWMVRHENATVVVNKWCTDEGE